MMTETTSIDHLDFQPEIPCDGRKGECPNRADYLVRHHCPTCGWSAPGATGFACVDCWVGRSRRITRCRICGVKREHANAWRIVEVIK